MSFERSEVSLHIQELLTVPLGANTLLPQVVAQFLEDKRWHRWIIFDP